LAAYGSGNGSNHPITVVALKKTSDRVGEVSPGPVLSVLPSSVFPGPSSAFLAFLGFAAFPLGSFAGAASGTVAALRWRELRFCQSVGCRGLVGQALGVRVVIVTAGIKSVQQALEKQLASQVDSNSNSTVRDAVISRRSLAEEETMTKSKWETDCRAYKLRLLHIEAN